MIDRYVPPARARHRVEQVAGITWLLIPARRNWFAILFLPIWLTGWTAGGVMAGSQVVAGTMPPGERLFIAIWMCAWAVGWIFAAATLAWQFVGGERIAIDLGDLVLRVGIGGIGRTRRYRGTEVRNLRVSSNVVTTMMAGGMEPFMPGMTGTLRFDHGARTIAFASGIDEAEAATVRDWLLARLPAARPST